MCGWSFVTSSGPITFFFYQFNQSRRTQGFLLVQRSICKLQCSICGKRPSYREKTFTSTVINWDLHLAAVCEGLKKMDGCSEATSCLVLPSSSSRFQPSSFFSASKGFLNCTFWPTRSEMSEKTGSQGCVSVGKLNLRQKKALSAPLESLSHVKVTSNGKQYKSKHPPASTPPSPALI